MSAPHTNIHKQERRHRVPLGGMKLGVIVAALLLLIYVAYEFVAATGPDDTQTVPETTSSTVEQSEPGLVTQDGGTTQESAPAMEAVPGETAPAQGESGIAAESTGN
ncbi:hypothetical protein [Sagittula salina]|uniref:Uncharacterized protein n=1 Tax=Sagittula salina TaxID=2820268 RepID=A0A940S287_9RHOB|nr:hypothetical protein [Sagittula salina]MBP0481759.1 hypothetical protein [Sagittula salina]